MVKMHFKKRRLSALLLSLFMFIMLGISACAAGKKNCDCPTFGQNSQNPSSIHISENESARFEGPKWNNKSDDKH